MPTGTSASTPIFGTIPQIADYILNGYWAVFGPAPHKFSHTDITVNISSLNTTDQSFCLAALAAFSSVCNISFSVTDGAADITYTDVGSKTFEAHFDLDASGSPVNATINISTDVGSPDFGPVIGPIGTYMHETGFVLGLGHPGPYDTGFTTYGIDNI